MWMGRASSHPVAVGDDGQVLISVSDTGVGLPAANRRNQIFKCFLYHKGHAPAWDFRESAVPSSSHMAVALWASENSRGVHSFCFALPIKADAHE